MKLVGYLEDPGSPRKRSIGLLVGNHVAPLGDVDAFYDDVAGHLARATAGLPTPLALGGLVLAPPVPRDAKVICAAINYVKHGREAALEPPKFPNLFARWSAELVADGERVPVPVAEPDGLDWEVELAAIVGRTLTDVDAAEATAGILGYTVANDISGRAGQLQAGTQPNGQWGLGKNVEKSGAIGSIIATADSVDPANIKLKTTVDNEVMQSGTTADMIFSCGELIAFASRHVTLRPGDILLTGTPEGVGLGRNPRRYMKPGSSVTVEAHGICRLTNPIVGSDHRG